MHKRIIIRVLGLFAWVAAPALTTAQEADLIGLFHDSVAQGDTRAVKDMLAEDPSLATSVGPIEFQPMHLQDLYLEEDIRDLLISYGADINSGNDEGVTILHIITDPDPVPVLVDRGANLEARDVRGWTPLLMQVQAQQIGPGLVQALLQAGADVNARMPDGSTALALAIGYGADPG